MYKNKKILGLIAARGGSKGLPRKNILPLLGKPVIVWTIEAALKSRYLDEVIVTTDSQEIAKVAARHGAKVPFLRPKILATDKAKSVDVVFHALQFLKDRGLRFDYIALLEPTSPLREVEDIDRPIKMLLDDKKGALSIVGISKVGVTHPAFDVTIGKKGFLKSYEGGFKKSTRRQDISSLYFFEGTIYVSSVRALYKKKSFYHQRTLPYIVPQWKAPELDDALDFVCIEAIMKNKKNIIKGKIQR